MSNKFQPHINKSQLVVFTLFRLDMSSSESDGNFKNEVNWALIWKVTVIRWG